MKTTIYILIIIVVCALVQSVTVLPWWSFTVPVFFIGVLMGKKQVNKMPFFTGFLAGFIIWVAATFFFHIRYGGRTLEVIPSLINFKKPVAVIIIGLIGGLITGLSLLSGYMLFKKEDKDGLKIQLKS